MAVVSLVAASDPLSVPTWVTAIFTGVLALFAVVTAVFAILAFRKQSREVTALERQVRDDEDDRRREAEERRRAQAILVYLTTELFPAQKARPGNVQTYSRPATPPAVAVTVRNTSSQPVYGVRIHWVDAASGAQAGAEDVLGTLPPGDPRRTQRSVPDGTVQSLFTPVAYFRDAAGGGWTVLPDGHLSPVDPSLAAGASLIATTALRRTQSPQPAGTSRVQRQLTLCIGRLSVSWRSASD